MEHPVYPFRAVLRALRQDAGLTVLGAAEATFYGNYERWESGQTRVGGQYLGTIADAFGIADDLHLFLYAWLLDQLTPEPGGPVRRLALEDIRKHLRHAPESEIDLGEHKALVIEPGRHVDVALLSLTSRYHHGGLVVLPAAERSPLPSSDGDGTTLTRLYGDVVNGCSVALGRALIMRSLDDGPAIDVSNIAPALADPDTYRELADAVENVPTPVDPIGRFTVGLAPEARRFADLLAAARGAVRQLLDAAGEPATDAAVEHMTEKMVAGKIGPMVRLLARALARGRLPDVDRSLITELAAMHTRIEVGWREAAARQVTVELQQAEASDVFDALDAVRGRRIA